VINLFLKDISKEIKKNRTNLHIKIYIFTYKYFDDRYLSYVHIHTSGVLFDPVPVIWVKRCVQKVREIRDRKDF